MYIDEKFTIQGNDYELTLVGDELFVTLPNKPNDLDCVELFTIIDQIFNGLYTSIVFTRTIYMLLVLHIGVGGFWAVDKSDKSKFPTEEVSIIKDLMNAYVSTDLHWKVA